MSEFQEDMIFKNVADKDARLFLDIIGKTSKKIKIMTKELRQLDPKTFVPDIILELDDEILIIELQSTKVSKRHHKRFHIYVAISDYNFDEMGKEVNLCVFSTAESSKMVSHYVNRDNNFNYEVISLEDYDSEEIIKTITYKVENNLEISGKELILFALVPIIEKEGNLEENVDFVVDMLIDLKELAPSIKALAYGIEWLIVDKFVKDELKRNILCDKLGDRMTLIDEYAEKREKKGIDKGMKEGMDKGIKKGREKGENNIIKNLLKAGMNAEIIAKTADIPLSRVKAIEKTLNTENLP